MEPHIRLAPRAARIPSTACAACVPPKCMVLKPSITAAATIATVPSTTLATFARLAPFSSPKSSRPHRIPISEFVFHRGNAIARPTSRMANTVSVLATAHSMPARIAKGINCVLRRRSRNTARVPLSRVGTLQRAVNTPATMHREIAYGDRPVLTSLVGASAAPSHTPAPMPHSTPRPCLDCTRIADETCGCVLTRSDLSLISNVLSNSLVHHDQKRDSGKEHDRGNKKLAIRQHGLDTRSLLHRSPLLRFQWANHKDVAQRVSTTLSSCDSRNRYSRNALQVRHKLDLLVFARRQQRLDGPTLSVADLEHDVSAGRQRIRRLRNQAPVRVHSAEACEQGLLRLIFADLHIKRRAVLLRHVRRI